MTKVTVENTAEEEDIFYRGNLVENDNGNVIIVTNESDTHQFAGTCVNAENDKIELGYHSDRFGKSAFHQCKNKRIILEV